MVQVEKRSLGSASRWRTGTVSSVGSQGSPAKAGVRGERPGGKDAGSGEKRRRQGRGKGRKGSKEERGRRGREERGEGRGRARGEEQRGEEAPGEPGKAGGRERKRGREERPRPGGASREERAGRRRRGAEGKEAAHNPTTPRHRTTQPRPERRGRRSKKRGRGEGGDRGVLPGGFVIEWTSLHAEHYSSREIAGIVNLICLSTSRIIGATRRPHVCPACIESDVAVTVSNAATRLVTEECDWGACIYTCRNSIGAACIHAVDTNCNHSGTNQRQLGSTRTKECLESGPRRHKWCHTI